MEIAPRVWWVGSLLPGDQFQCHVYLVEQGDQSVIIDPGSALNTDEVIRKVDAVIGLSRVRWVVCTHSDPDIIGGLRAMAAQGLHPEATIVTHWRDEALIRHCGTALPFWRIEEHDWQLPLEDRTLRFVFTPYAHFAGAFGVFDAASGTLFSSDLFGGFTDDQSLFATSEDYFEAMRAFHEHYMPSHEILAYAISQFRDLPIRQIAPQHGQIIPDALVTPLMDRLAELECGIYLLAREDPGLAFLLTANRALHDVIDTLVQEADFSVVATQLADLAGRFLGAIEFELWAQLGTTTLVFDRTDGFAGHVAKAPSDIRRALTGQTVVENSRLAQPLRSRVSTRVGGAAMLQFRDKASLDAPTRALVDQIAALLEVGVEREVLRRTAELERGALYERAIHDPLTGLYNRVPLADAGRRLCALDDRGPAGHVAAVMIDVDHFKQVNDTHGHPVGDRVLQHVASAITQAVRPGDMVVRYGGEEFLVLLSGVDDATGLAVAERIRTAVAVADGDVPEVTVSLGIAFRRAGDDLETMTNRADASLYEAKMAGRDRVHVAA